jgi:hypothetical protein
MQNSEWLRAYDSLRVIARNEAIQTISIQIIGNEQETCLERGGSFALLTFLSLETKEK